MVHVLSGGTNLDLPEDVVLSTEGTPGAITEIVAGHRFRISGPSFFQCRPDGAEAMVALVAEAIGMVEGPLIDAYAGVGLFGAILGADRPLTSVEVAGSSVADSRHNLPDHAVIVETPVEEWTPTPAAAVVADPARAGLGREGADVISGTGADVIALVSCDVASMARDVALLSERGYHPDWARVLDLFGHTSHVEVVTRLIRT
jgi:23S rRNA (uracil1939-C5)-methyltransferase